MEWLTTGQMIDKLKVGEFAEGNTYWEVKKLDDGSIVELNTGCSVEVEENFLKERWRILPNYVTFEEAKEAYIQGKTVRCDYISAINQNAKCSQTFTKGTPDYVGDITWYLITEGKWAIEGAK